MTRADVSIARACNPERSDHEQETKPKTDDPLANGSRSSYEPDQDPLRSCPSYGSIAACDRYEDRS